MCEYLKNIVKFLFSGNETNNSDNNILDLKISNNINISQELKKVNTTIIRKDLFNNNYYFKYLFIDNNEYKFNNLRESVDKNYIIHKKNLVKNSKKLFKNIYIKNNNVYKCSYYHDKQNYIHIIRYLKNNKVPNIILPNEIYEEILSTPDLATKIIIQISPYKKYGDLYTYVDSNKLKYYEIYAIFYKLIRIIKCLHKLNISHRDIKLENILIDFSPNLELYLIDFEYSNHSSDYSKFNGGTVPYVSPELLKNKQINNYKCLDIWALGIILYILIFKLHPWEIANPKICDYYYNFVNNSIYFNNSLNSINIPLHKVIYTKILNYCFNLNYKKRIDINYIYNLL